MIKFKRITAIVFSAIIMLTGCSTAGDEQPAKEEITVALPTDLTEEEMAIWETMPQVVTMRFDNTYKKREYTSTSVVFIEKNGAIREFEISDKNDKYWEGNSAETKLEWAAQKFTEAENYEITGTIDVHKLIEFYSVMSKINTSNKITDHYWSLISPQIYHEYTGYWEIYGARNDKNEIIEVAHGQYNIDGYYDDLYGYDALKLYVGIDRFTLIGDDINWQSNETECNK